MMLDYKNEFISYALECGVLKFGQFVLKSGRVSPYFFNTGLFDTGAKLAKLGKFYAQALLHSGIKADNLYGPAYKGIPLVCATAIAYAELIGSDMPFAFNRKEAKDHGEGGGLVGAALAGEVVIVDDVISAGTSVRESVAIIRQNKASPVAVLIALDRQERGQQTPLSAAQEVNAQFGLPVVAIITLGDLVAYLQGDPRLDEVRDYQASYGVG